MRRFSSVVCAIAMLSGVTLALYLFIFEEGFKGNWLIAAGVFLIVSLVWLRSEMLSWTRTGVSPTSHR